MTAGNVSRERWRPYAPFLLLIPVLFFALLEGLLRVSGYGPDLALFVPARDAGRADYLEVNPLVALRYFPASEMNFLPRPANDIFRRTKRLNAYRIFVMGESTTEGWPYPSGMMFSRLLWRKLSALFPDREIEVVNTGITAMNSYALRDFTDEILAQRPDAIIIYAGHNEYYGAMGVASTVSPSRARPLVELSLFLERFKTFLLVRDAVDLFRQERAAPRDTPDQATLMARVIGNARVPYGSRDYEIGREQFRRNLSDILEKTRRAGVPVVLSELVSNVRDQAPLGPVASASWPPADQVFREATALEAAGDLSEAKKRYVLAKDLDGMRFRASEEINGIIHALGVRYHAAVVPLLSAFERESPNGLLGATLFLEHLHPNARGYLIMSEAVADTLRTQGFIARDWPDRPRSPYVFPQGEDSLSEIDRAVGDLQILYLKDHWPFTSAEDSGKAVARFEPRTAAEAIALRYLRRRLPLEKAYLEMADALIKEGRVSAARNELQGLVNTWPYAVEHYVEAADRLLAAGRDDDALPFLYQSLAIEDTGQAAKRIGEIWLRKSDRVQARTFLTRALRLLPDDAELRNETQALGASTP